MVQFFSGWRRIRHRSLVSKAVLLLLLATGMAFFSCSGSGDWASRINWELPDYSQLPGSEEYPDADAIVLLNDGKMEVYGNRDLGFSIFEQHTIVKILDVRGQRFANIMIPYTPESQVENIRARTITPEGKIIALDKIKIFDVTLYPNFVFYSDQRAKIFTMPAAGKGSIIEYRYEINIRSRTFKHYWNFQRDIPTLLSRFTLVKPSEWDLNYRLYGLDLKPDIKNGPKGFKSTYTWQATDVPALKSEFGMPPANELTAHLMLAPAGIKTWDDVSGWYDKLSEPQMKTGPRLRAAVEELTRGADSDEEKLRNIFDWVRDQVRYIAVEVGIGGYQPHAADEVFANQYGDCKDMTTLLCAMAREAGIEAHQVLVSTWQNGAPDTTLPSPLHFNHAIAYCPTVGEMGTWMDATEKGIPFGKVPWYDQGLPVLVIGKEGKAQIITTPKDKSENNGSAMRWDVTLDSSGNAIVEGQNKYYGALASEIRESLFYLSRDRQREWLQNDLAQRCSGIRLDSMQIEGLSPVKDPLRIAYVFNTSQFGLLRSSKLIINPGSISRFELPDYFRSVHRAHRIRFKFGTQTEFTLNVTLPQKEGNGLQAFSDSVSSAFGSAAWSWNPKKDGSGLEAKTRYVLKGEDIPPARYPDFQNFLDRVRAGDLQEVVLTLPDAPALTKGDLKKVPLIIRKRIDRR
ncbi:MAG: DUF3857 and transglutaminase domain-containing protein [Calditrichia bacterium]